VTRITMSRDINHGAIDDFYSIKVTAIGDLDAFWMAA
jgi:hypothetical protein